MTIDDKRIDKLLKLEKRLQYEFQDINKLVEYFTLYYYSHYPETEECLFLCYPKEEILSAYEYNSMIKKMWGLLESCLDKFDDMKEIEILDEGHLLLFLSTSFWLVEKIDSDPNSMKAQALFILIAVYADCNDQHMFLDWLNPHIKRYINMQQRKTNDALMHNSSESTGIVQIIKQTTTGFRKIVLGLGRYRGQMYMTPLLASIPEEQNSSNYFNRFLVYIIEEIRAAFTKQLDKIANKNWKPFLCNIIDYHQSGTGLVKMRCQTKHLPRLDHGFYQELVYIIIPEANTSKERKQTLRGVLAIAEVSYLPRKDREFKPTELTLELSLREYGEVKDANKVIEVHWLTGLIPSSRMYEVCTEMPSVQFEHEFIRGKLPTWPLAMQPSEFTLPLADTPLNEQQQEVVQQLVNAESGLFLLQGPPGTGKTTTMVNLVMQLVAKHPSERILITAPSNQAVQVILQQLVSLLPQTTMALTGVNKGLPPKLQEVHANDYCDWLLNPLGDINRRLMCSNTSPGMIKQCHKQLEHSLELIYKKLQTLRNHKGNMLTNNESLGTSFDALIQEVQLCRSHIDSISQQFRHDQNTLRAALIERTDMFIELLQRKSNREVIECFLVQRAQLVFSTLVTSGRKWLSKQIPTIPIVILDEAAQALIPEALIPLKFKPRLYIQAGDPKQLPATLISTTTRDGGYANSMMHVLAEGLNQPHTMLTTQYRMHSDICSWPSMRYYDDRLITPECVMNRQNILGELDHRLQKPSIVFDIYSGIENKYDSNSDSSSISNKQEALYLVNVLKYLVKKGNFKGKQIGVISFYAAQVELIKQRLSVVLGQEMSKGITVSTVDGFQGGERDIVLISVVRTSSSTGFLVDQRRINVAMTRAKHGCWVFGNKRSLTDSNCDFSNYLIHNESKYTLVDESTIVSVCGGIGEESGDNHNGKINGDNHNGKINGDNHNGKINGDNHNGKINGDNHNGKINGDNHNGKIKNIKKNDGNINSNSGSNYNSNSRNNSKNNSGNNKNSSGSRRDSKRGGGNNSDIKHQGIMNKHHEYNNDSEYPPLCR